jgi:LCP family protein required for cell wall assembly
MHAGQEAPPRHRSPFVAAVLSLLFPGLGQLYAGAPARALAFAAPPLLLLALGAGVFVRLDLAQLGGLAIQSQFLTGLLIANLGALLYRIIAVVDAWRVAHYLNAFAGGGRGRVGRPRMALDPLSIAGLVAVVLVLSGAHVAVARYDLVAMSAADCIFDPDCVTSTPAPTGSGAPSASPAETSEPTESLPPVGTAVASQTAVPWDGEERLNILLIGADEQEGGHNTDTLIVVSIDPVTDRVAMFSLPRDTVDVPIPPGPARNIWGSVYRGKINSFFVQARNRPDAFPGTDQTRGYNALKSVLGELYGLDIKYFVEVNFEGFEQVVDAFGGVNVNVQIPVLDDHYPLGGGRNARIYLPSGPQHMTGHEALIYARSRHQSSVFDRGARQQRVLLSLQQQADPEILLPRLPELVDALKRAVRTDIPLDQLDELLGLAAAVDTSNIRSYVFAPPLYSQDTCSDPRGCVVLPKIDRIKAAVKNAFTEDPRDEALRESLAAEGAQVWVLNGTNTQNRGSRLAGFLEYHGLAASAPRGTPDGPVPAKTVVTVYNGAEADLPGTIAYLESLFKVTVKTATDPAIRADVVITIGRDTPEHEPPPSL